MTYPTNPQTNNKAQNAEVKREERKKKLELREWRGIPEKMEGVAPFSLFRFSFNLIEALR